jgi:predicted XRE-type DNA-binding protein
MNDDEFELVRGSGNVFADFGVPDADMRQLRASLAAEVIKALDSEGLSTRAAAKLTGTSAADFSRIRNAKLAGFTADRLMNILQKLHRKVSVIVTSPRGGRELQRTHA